MKTVRFAIFGLLLAAGVALAVSTVAAQERRALPAPTMFDGWGRQLGATVRDLDADARKAAGAANGVQIADVSENSAAAKAGLQEGDIVVDVDGERIYSARQFTRLIQEGRDGTSVKLGILRGGNRQTIEVTPDARPFGFGIDGDRIGRELERTLRDLEPQLRALEPRLRQLEPWLRALAPQLRDFDFDFNHSPRVVRLGVQLDDLTPQLETYFGVKDGGVLVSSVSNGSAAEKAGLKAGDVITSINGDRVRRSSDVIEQLRDNAGEVTLGIVRDKKELTLKADVR